MSTNGRHFILVAASTCGIILAGVASQAAASGFAVPEISITGLGTSNALVANPEELGAIPYNPAAMAFHEGTTISVGTLLLAPDIQVTTATGSHSGEGADLVAIPQLQVSATINEYLSTGFSVTAPFGLSTDWDDDAPGVFPAAGFIHPTTSELEIIDISPTVAFKLNDNLSLSVGADYYWVKSVVFNATIVKNSGDGAGWGWNAGLLASNGPWSFGLNYHSAVEVDIDGETEYMAPHPAAGTYDAATKLPIPSRLQVGMRFKPTDELAVEFDVTRTGWKSFDLLTINNTSGLPVTSNNHWKSANAYRLGATYQATPKTQLRFGYTLDKTGQPDEFYSPRIPDADRHLFSIGLGHDLGDGWNLNLGYMYVQFKDSTHAATGFTIPAEPNGSILYNGDYEANVHIFGAGLSKTF